MLTVLVRLIAWILLLRPVQTINVQLAQIPLTAQTLIQLQIFSHIVLLRLTGALSVSLIQIAKARRLTATLVHKPVLTVSMRLIA